jgi:FMN phosphatase YigB (HAD superfamily)
MSFRCVAFDLDDTLLDTCNLLIPAAARESAEAMAKAGLAASPEQALAARAELFRQDPRLPIYGRIVARFGVVPGADAGAVAEAGRLAFTRRDVDPSLVPFPAATKVLDALRAKYKLYLVTSGDSATQMRKVEVLGLEPRFDAVFAVDASRGERKGGAFAKILRLSGQPAELCLSVGNRVDTDIGEAKALGWRTCWLRHGEYVHMRPRGEAERPDFAIDRIEELIEACNL